MLQEAVDDLFQLTQRRFCIHFFANDRPKVYLSSGKHINTFGEGLIFTISDIGPISIIFSWSYGSVGPLRGFFPMDGLTVHCVGRRAMTLLGFCSVHPFIVCPLPLPLLPLFPFSLLQSLLISLSVPLMMTCKTSRKFWQINCFCFYTDSLIVNSILLLYLLCMR